MTDNKQTIEEIRALLLDVLAQLDSIDTTPAPAADTEKTFRFTRRHQSVLEVLKRFKGSHVQPADIATLAGVKESTVSTVVGDLRKHNIAGIDTKRGEGYQLNWDLKPGTALVSNPPGATLADLLTEFEL